MTFKINIGTEKGKTYKIEAGAEELVGKALGDKIIGKVISPEFEGYEFEITGASDNSGFAALKNVEGFTKKKVLLKYGTGMHKRAKKEGKKKRSNPVPRGLRLRKTAHGKIISEKIAQVNLKLVKEGNKKLSEIFSEKKE